MKNYIKKLGLKEEDIFLGNRRYPYNFNNAIRFLNEASAKKVPVWIIGDYDVDGIHATKILDEICKVFKINAYRRIPKRISEGYGLSEKIIEEIPEGAYIITVDNGIAAKEALIKAKEKGIKSMVIDHHLLPEDYEQIADVVYDCHMEDGSTYHDYCGAGMVYKFAEFMWGENHPFVKQLCIYAAIATIADSVPLLGDNRLIVQHGFDYVNKEGIIPFHLQLLMNQIGVNELNTSTVNFKIAPMINAPGRLLDDGAQIVSDFYATENKLQAEIMAGNIYEYNNERKLKLKRYKEEIAPKLADIDISHPVCLHIPDMGEGFLGLIAGWIVEQYNTAAFVTTNAENGEYKGSARSNGSVHIKNVLEKNKQYLTKHGGHECAGGFSLKEENLMILHKNLLQEDCFPVENRIIIHINQDDIPAWRMAMNACEPFGAGFPEPHFNCNFVSEERFGKYFETNGEQLPNTKYKSNVRLFGKNYEAFGYGKTEEYLQLNAPKRVNLTGTITTNIWNGAETIKFMIEEIKTV